MTTDMKQRCYERAYEVATHPANHTQADINRFQMLMTLAESLKDQHILVEE